MFSRLWNLEAAVVMLGGLFFVVGLALDSDLGWLTVPLGAAWLAVSIPLAMSTQAAAIPFYIRLGRLERALDLAVRFRDAAPSTKIRSIGAVDVAMVQIAMGRFEDALRNLESAGVSHFSTGTRALLIANRAYCRAHLSRDLSKALEEIEEASAALPDEGILTYVRGLVLHKLGREAEAREAIAASLRSETDPSLPVPGERPFIYAQVLEALGEGEAAAAQRAQALAQARRSPFRKAIEAAAPGR